MRTAYVSHFLILTPDSLAEKDVAQLKNALNQEFEHESKFVALDLSEINQACSLALGVLVKFHKQFSKAGGKLVLLKPTEVIRHLLEDTKLILAMPIATSEEELLKIL